MYRALKVFYLILIYLIYEKRRKLINIFILILNSYNIKLEEVIKVFYKFIRELDPEILLNINKEIITIYIFIIIFLDDIS